MQKKTLERENKPKSFFPLWSFLLLLPEKNTGKIPNLAEETKQEVMSGLERIINERSQQSLRQGIQQGMQQGIQQATRNLIQGMFEAGAPLPLIAQGAKLAESEIKEILGLDSKKKKKS